MTSSTVLITDVSILTAIFLLGLLAKIFPKNGRKGGQKDKDKFGLSGFEAGSGIRRRR